MTGENTFVSNWPYCISCGRQDLTARHETKKCLVCRLSNKPHAHCGVCDDDYPAEFVKNGLCSHCEGKLIEDARKEDVRRTGLIAFLGGERNHAEHRFELFKVIPENQAAFDAAKRFEPSVNNLYLVGPTGGGKTMLAGAIARTRYDMERPVIRETARELVRRVTRNGFKHEEEEIMRRVEAETLIIDDLGVGKITEGIAPIFYEIVSKRIDRNRNGLVITSNLGGNDLAAKLGDDRIPSRLNGLCRILSISGPGGRDWRDIKKGQLELNTGR